jgi:hypothetical protein
MLDFPSPHSEFRDSKFRRRMVDPPRLTQTRCQMGRSEKTAGTRTKDNFKMKANLKRGQQHPWRASLELRVTDVMELAEVASLWSSRGRSTIRRGEVRYQRSAVSLSFPVWPLTSDI